MVKGNDAKESQLERVKMCPFINGWCIKEGCALYQEMNRVVGGMRQTFGLCAFNAEVLILSEVNIKLQQGQPQPKIQIPNLLRG